MILITYRQTTDISINDLKASHPPRCVCVCVRTWEPGEQTVELPLGQRGPGQVQGDRLALDDAGQGLVAQRAAAAHIDVAPQALVAAPAGAWGQSNEVLNRQAQNDDTRMHARTHTQTQTCMRSRAETHHLYQALQTLMQVSSWARVKCLKTDTHTSFSPPFSLPTSLKEGRDSREGGDMERAGPAAAASSSSDEEPEEAKRPLTPRRRGLGGL